MAAICRRDPRCARGAAAELGGGARLRRLPRPAGLGRGGRGPIVAPTDSHFAIARDAVAAGKHVLCDKPLTLTAGEARTLLEAAERRGVVHAVNFNLRGRTALGRLRRYLDEGFVGEIYHLNVWWGMSLQYDLRPETGSWRYRPETGGGTIHELIHVLDFARFLAGEVKRICTLGTTSEPWRPFADVPEGMRVTVPDSCAHLLDFASGAAGVLHASFVSRGLNDASRAEPRIEVSGSRGRIVTVDGNRLQGISGGQGPLEELDVRSAGSDYPQPYEDFVEAIVTGRPLRSSSFHDGWKAAELVDAAYLSIAREGWVRPGGAE